MYIAIAVLFILIARSLSERTNETGSTLIYAALFVVMLILVAGALGL